MDENLKKEQKIWQLYTESENVQKEVFDTATEHKDTFRRDVDSLEATQKESQEISAILGDQTIELDEEVRASLEARQGRDLSHILINSKKLFGDSKEMKAVKVALRELERALTLERDDTTVISQEELETVENKYLEAIGHCNYYLSVKTTHTRSDRNNMVRERLNGLMDEYTRVSRMKAFLAENPESEIGKVKCTYALLLGSKLISIRRDTTAVVAQKPEQAVRRNQDSFRAYAEADDGLDAQDTATQEIIKLLTLTSKPSDYTGTPGDDGTQIAQGIFNLLKSFPEGIHAQYIHTGLFMTNGKRKWKNAEGKETFCDTIIGLFQDKAGAITVKVGGASFELPYSRTAILGRMRDNIVANSNKFDSQFVKDELAWIRTASLDKGSTVEIRNVCLKYIEKNAGVKATEFNNLTTEAIRTMAMQLMDGQIDMLGIKQCIELAEAYTLTIDENGEETLVRGNTTDRMVNGGETMEILKYREKRIEELRGTVLAQIGPNMMVELKKQLLKERMDAIKGATVVKAEKFAKKFGRLGEWVMGKVEDLAMDYIDKKIIEAIGQEAFNELMAAVNREVDKEVEAEIQRRVRAEIKEVRFVRTETAPAPVEEDEANRWKPEEEAVKNLVADMIFSKDTWKADETVEAPGVRLERLLYDNSSVLMSIIKNPNIIGDMIDKLPIPGTQILKEKFNELISSVGGDSSVVKILQEKTSPDLINLVIKSALSMSTVKAALAALEETIDSTIQENIATVQGTINQCVSALFPIQADTPEDETEIPSPYEVGISEEEKKRRIQAGVERLNAKLADSVSGDSGQARFTRLVFQNYFTNVPLMDQRAMLASAIRDMTPASAEIRSMESFENMTNEQKMKVAGKFLGGIFKGAGPLMQKILQGMPIDSIPEELRGAFEDVKSNLLPIPDEIVEAQLMSMVERSRGEVTKIEVTKVLGAASVGQAFLCKMYGPSMPDEGKNVVVKLLRPNVRNRMMREKAIMFSCASQTDAGMKKTYEGQLERIEAELDLTIEAENVERGQIYSRGSKEDHVRAMKLENLVSPTVNSMVIECAPGQTVDKYLKETEAEIKRIMETTGKSEGEVRKARVLISKKIAQMEKRQKYLISLSKKWVEEGLFGEGFYHGDLHAGNIMIDDDGATVIDFGNATQITAFQKEIVTQMMSAAVVGDVELFREGYHKLMDKNEAAEEHFQANKGRLDVELGKIFKLGDVNASAQRIAVALLKAQELGFELPAAIYNFSQCQIRLQQTVDSMNSQIKNMKSILNDKMTIPTAIMQGVVNPVAAVEAQNVVRPEFAVKNYTSMMHSLADSMSQEDFASKIYTMDPQEFDKYFLSEGRYNEKMRPNDIMKDFYTNLIDCFDKDLPATVITSRIAAFTHPAAPFIEGAHAFKYTIGEQNYERLIALIQNPIENKDEILRIAATYKTLPELVQELRAMHESGASPDEIKAKEEMVHKVYIHTMKNDVPQTYDSFEKSGIANCNSKLEMMFNTQGVSEGQLRKQYQFLGNTPENKAVLDDCIAKRSAYFDARKHRTEDMEPKKMEYLDSLKKLEELYTLVSMKNLYDERAKYKTEHPGEGESEELPNIEREAKFGNANPEDFMDVMGDVLGKHTKETLSRLGWFFLIKYHRELSEMGN